MKIINKALVLLAIVSLVFAFNPGRTYASNPVQDSPICTITADNLNPTPSSSVTENFTVSFNSGITSSDQTWYLYLNAHLGDGSSGGSVNPSNVVVNSNDFPSSLAKYGDGNALISSTTVSEDAVAGNTYHISTTWDAHNVQVGTVWLPQFSNDSNNGCYTGNTNTSITFQASIPSAPTNLTATSPTQNPSLSWSAVSGATSYNIYRNSSLVDSVTTSNTTSYTDFLASEGTNTYYVTAVNSGGESGHSNSVSVLVDRTAPTITYAVSPTSNSSGWNNSGPVTVTFTCTDNSGGSGIASCSSPQTESVDGTYTLTGSATDNAGNSSNVNVTVKIDSTLPTVANVTLATDPLAVNQTTTLSANVSDNSGGSGIAKAEYFIGTDPGAGNGTSMNVTGSTATATVGSYATAGMHTYYVRTQDNAGNWSTPMSVTLDVYNPAGGYAAAHGSVVPNGSTSNPDDTLPTETGNNLKAAFDFTVKYVNSTDTTPTGTSNFTWGSTCNNPHADCFTVTTDTTANPAIGSLAWLIDPGDNTASFQGTASVSQGSTSLGTNYPVRISVTGTTTTTPGHYLLQVYSVGANPNTASPLYQASGDLSGGSVVLHG